MRDCHRAASDNRTALWPLTHRRELDKRASWFFPFVRTRLWLNTLHVVINSRFKVAVINIFISYGIKMKKVFGICRSITASFSSSFIRPDKRFFSWCHICSMKSLKKSSSWKTSTRIHGCSDELCVNQTSSSGPAPATNSVLLVTLKQLVQLFRESRCDRKRRRNSTQRNTAPWSDGATWSSTVWHLQIFIHRDVSELCECDVRLDDRVLVTVWVHFTVTLSAWMIT